MPKVNIDLQVKTKENKKTNSRGVIHVSSRRATGFHRQAKLFDLNFVIKKNLSPTSGWLNQVGKIIITASQFAQVQPFMKLLLV